MRARLFWLLVAVALVALGVALAAGSQPQFAVPASAAAVIAGGLLFLEAALSRPPAPSRPPPTAAPIAATGTRSHFRSGRFGRESLLDLLDRLERAGPNPDLPSRSVSETRALVTVSPERFRELLAERLDRLEEMT